MSYQLSDVVFMALYASEFILKIYAYGNGYFKSLFNQFDFLVLVLSSFDFFQQTFELTALANINLRVFQGIVVLSIVTFI